MTNQFNVEKDIKEIPLPGEKLQLDTNDLDLISNSGAKLYSVNRNFIKEHVEDNWFVVIEPVSGLLIACPDELNLLKYAQKKFPGRIFFNVGLLKNNFLQYVQA